MNSDHPERPTDWITWCSIALLFTVAIGVIVLVWQVLAVMVQAWAFFLPFFIVLWLIGTLFG